MSNLENFDIKSQVVESIIEVFDTMVSMEIVPSDSEPEATKGVSRVVAGVNMAGNIAGILNIQVTTELARLMAANMLDMEPEELEGDGEMKDLLSEISNIVGGNLKSALNDAGLTCVLSTPSMTYGGDFTIKSLNMERFERFVFMHQQDAIIVEVGIKTQQGGEEGAGLSATDAMGQLKDVDVEKVNAIDIKAQVAESIIDVFDTMFSATLKPSDSVTAESQEGIRNVGSVSFAGDVTGMVSIHVSEIFAQEMAAEMLGMEAEEIEGDEEVRDMLGEVGNIVGGNLKSSFTDAGLTCVLSTPSFTTGTDFKIEALNMEKYERFAFKCDENIVFVEMGVKICELAQVATPQGKDIHYAVNESGAEEQETPAAEEVQPETAAGEGESDSGTVSQSEIDAALAAANAPEAQEPQSAPPQAPQADQAPAMPPSPPPPAPQADPSAPEAPESKPSEDVDLDLLLDIPLEIKVELGRAKIQIQELLNLAPGSAVKLIKLEGEPVDILANETLIARGEVVVQKEKYGIRVTEITSRLDRIRSFGL
jgi:flagellar motor switch protein FliN